MSPKQKPVTLYTHLKDADGCDRRRIVKDFCFPSGNRIARIKDLTELKSIMYNTNTRQMNFSFVFNNSEDSSEDSQSQDKFEVSKPEVLQEQGLNCLCLQFQEILLLERPGNHDTLQDLIDRKQILKVQKAFCFMFKHLLHQTFLDLFQIFLYAQKLDRLELSQEFMVAKQKNCELNAEDLQLYCDVLSMTE